MPKSFFSANSYDNQFNASTSDNPQGATVSEGLSGNAHLLKSADNSVAYKNLTGSQIEDTTLVQGSHNKTLQTDWTDEYDDDVNTDLTETAPIINNQAILTQSHSSAYNNLNENVNTTNEAHSIKTPTWQAFHQNIQTQTPTTLNQTVAQSGSNTTGTLQSQVQIQNTNASNLNHNFGTLTQNGNVNLSGTTQVGSQTLNIGGPSQAVKAKLTPLSVQQQPAVYAFYIVTTDGIRYHLTDSIDFSEITGSFDLADFFEEERWLPEENDSSSDEEDELDKTQVVRLGSLSSFLATLPMVYRDGVKHYLVSTLQQMLPQFQSQIPSPPRGLLLQANYMVCEDELQPKVDLNNIYPVGSGSDYNPLIKKAMTGSFARPTLPNNLWHWEYLFIWVTKN